MKDKYLKRIGLISIAIIAALVLSLAGVTFLTNSQPKANAADTSTLYKAEYKGENGTAKHVDASTIAARYGVSTTEVVKITSGSMLFAFLNGTNYNYKVGYLSTNVSISYDSAHTSGYDYVGVSSSAAIFEPGRVLDGNGWEINIYGGVGISNSTNEVTDAQDYRATYRKSGGLYDKLNVWYEYTGFLVAQNYGTINNCTINYDSSHTIIDATSGVVGSETGGLGMDTTNRIFSRSEGVFSAGIVAGLNGYGGVIDNVKINATKSFTVVKRAGKTGYYLENGCYAGAIAGRAEDNSTINNCWVDLADGGGVFAGSQGKSGTAAFASTDNLAVLAMAGGIVGNINAGTAKISYCALTGSGAVKAFGNRAAKNGYYKIYAGGVTGGCIQISDNMTIEDGWTSEEPQLKYGQIQGILSSWTGSRFTNLDNTPRQTVGSLFGVVGTDDNILSVALLYNFETLAGMMVDETTPCKMEYFKTNDGKFMLDSAQKFKNWVEINPTTEGGYMTAQFDREDPKFDIRIHIIADGHDDINDSTLNEIDLGGARYYQLKMRDGDGGNFIWSGTFATANDSSNHINLTLDDPIYAEIYMITSTNTGKYNYEFGRMGLLEYIDTNGENGRLVKPYNGAAAPLQLPDVRMTNYPAFDTSVFKDQDLWNITRSNKEVKIEQAYMPGTYNMKVETHALGERTYGYYSEEERMLAWQPSSDYVFTILQGAISFGEGTTATDGWQSSVTFELKMNARTDFDKFEFQRNGVFPSDSASGFTLTNTGSTYYTVDRNTLPAGTGKNGTAYTFYAYKIDSLTGESVLVAVSSSVTVRIDNQAPEVSDIEYYTVEADGQERLLSDDEVDELTYIDGANENQKWTKNQILAKFTITENGKSGIAIAPNASYIEEKELNGDGDRDVTVTISDSNPISLTYVDAKGNGTTIDLRFNIDRTQGRLLSAGTTYSTTGRFNYSTQNVTVFYRADFGSSGWRLDYSYQKDAEGNDIWETYSVLSSEDSGAVRTFVIDWNMGDVVAGTGEILKLKIVNTVGLYDDVEVEIMGDVDKDTKENLGFIIWLRLANIFIDINFNNIFVDDNGTIKTVEEILQSEEDREKYFDKQYDSTDEYDGKKEYKFYADLSALNADRFYVNDKAGVIYTSAGMSKRPKINVGVNGIVPVTLRYASSEVGDTQLFFRVELSGNDYFNYIVYFTDLSAIDFYEDVDVEEDTYWESYSVDAKINKSEITIKLSEQEAFKDGTIYYYGDEVPTAIDVYVKQTGAYITVQTKTKASSTSNIGEYSVTGTAPNGYKNIEYIVEQTNITIYPRPVAIDLRFDDGEVGNIPTGVQAGRTHKITGTYTDVNGETQNAIVEYVFGDNNTVSSLGAVGLYTVNLSLGDNNYVISGQKSFKFNIAKGQLEIEMGIRVKDYTEGEVKYDLIIPEDSKGLYDDSDLKITYYEYLDGAKYIESEGRIEGKISDDPMTECPTERGYYRVVVDFVSTTNPNFFPNNYTGDLVIASAKTQINVEKTVLRYYFTSEKFTFNLIDAVTEVRSSSNKELWAAGMSAEGIVKVQYKERGSFKDVAPDPNKGGGWFSETGRYEYKIIYLGNDDYNTSSIDVVMIIDESELVGISFNPIEVVYDGNNHLPVANLNNYTDIKVAFQYGTSIVKVEEGVNANDALKNNSKFNFVNVGEYTVYLTVAKTGYVTKELTTKVVIKKAKMENVRATLVDVEYDGEIHAIAFVGLDYENGSYKYKGEIVTLKAGSNTEGNTYAVNVRMEEGVGPSYYSGEVTLVSRNYEDLVLKTNITIRQALLPYLEIGKTLPNKLPSGISLSEYSGYYIDKDGNSVECALQYRDRNGNVVELDEEGKLADGKYTVMLVITDTNYYLDRYWNLEVGEINSAELSVYGIAAIAAVGALMGVAVITAIVVVKKRKKAGIV